MKTITKITEIGKENPKHSICEIPRFILKLNLSSLAHFFFLSNSSLGFEKS